MTPYFYMNELPKAFQMPDARMWERNDRAASALADGGRPAAMPCVRHFGEAR